MASQCRFLTHWERRAIAKRHELPKMVTFATALSNHIGKIRHAAAKIIRPANADIKSLPSPHHRTSPVLTKFKKDEGLLPRQSRN